jgi:hypothetical protein
MDEEAPSVSVDGVVTPPNPYVVAVGKRQRALRKKVEKCNIQEQNTKSGKVGASVIILVTFGWHIVNMSCFLYVVV